MADLNIDIERFSTFVLDSHDTDLADSNGLTIARDHRVAIQWAPFDYTPPEARLVIVGITPGRQQANNALQAYRDALRRGEPQGAALRHAKFVGSFSGDMRKHLVPMLDSIGVDKYLGVASCAKVFDPGCTLAHFTSALRYPVFIDGANYNGTPEPLRTPLLRQVIETFLAQEARALPNALWLPLGPKPATVVEHLSRMGLIPADHVLSGMPHPSPANIERIRYFLGLKDRSALSSRTRADTIDAARDALLQKIVTLQSIQRH